MTTSPPHAAETAEQVVAEMVRRARTAQAEFAGYSQERVDHVVAAVAWAIAEPTRALELAELAVRDTGLGNVEDKTLKNRRKTMGTLRDLTGAKSVGIISDDPKTGITEYAKPMGVVAAVCPSTNPAATPANKAMMVLKGGNAVILSPSPKGASTCALLVRHIHEQFDRLGVPRDLVQYTAVPSKAVTYELMRQADFVVVTGSQKNVRAAYSSGTPAIGVGVGNAPVIIDADADLDDAAAKIHASKTFDYATSCSSENSVHIHTDVYDAAIDALRRQGAYLVSAQEKRRLQQVMWPDGKLSAEITAQPPGKIAALAGFNEQGAHDADFFLVEEDGYGPDHPFSGEKLSVVLTVYRFTDLDEALDRIQGILDFQGAGHSCGIHTKNDDRARHVAERLKVARVLVNQAHCFGTGGGFDNGLGFTLTMGAGTWAGNSISHNLSYRDFLNITRLARVIPACEPTEADLWGSYFETYGR
ncbi:acylating sulfoacetaldehyde dehydrogenase [Mycobacterium sherrisii]|uniref:Putative succinate-semialdehyde dehydrogenase [NADP(+)] 2 n=1 Tax=Mycobacterium sherrisii TaxID=243061 RepID=A0A1E3T0M7_9MYCO|nr:aldehyde dehydrogenase family protein [Mycobacterium sherrisii]MCV7028287.1 aldehyde dehydrogenase family protein [Mycobacterium sherrisii]ODR07979.1 sulfoacetaldehyde dehydrogenase [Mycobacterium sherrisii]ORW77880.1 sulfoacetaldehyde dehydrogenase [Mycobacterium sherrisii]